MGEEDGWILCMHNFKRPIVYTHNHQRPYLQAAYLEAALQGATTEASALRGEVEEERGARLGLERRLAEREEAWGQGCVIVVLFGGFYAWVVPR